MAAMLAQYRGDDGETYDPLDDLAASLGMPWRAFIERQTTEGRGIYARWYTWGMPVN